MTREPRVVVDTNVLVSFFLRRGSTPWRAVREVLECGELLVSDDTIAELEEVLRRSKFDRYISRATREQFLITLPEFATPVAILERIEACRILGTTSSSRLPSTGELTSWWPVTVPCCP
jgi:putative PIN family toxin of toxin-antitoxin system